MGQTGKMRYQIGIYSGDAVFARMLALEFQMRDMTVFAESQPRTDVYAEVILLDLDTAAPPPAECYRRMIGFTRTASLSTDEVRRQCSMILRRPFRMQMLRQEVLAELAQSGEAEPIPMGQRPHLTLHREERAISLGDARIELTETELCVMQALLEARGETVSRKTLSERIGESKANKTDVYICMLRQKLERVSPWKWIETVRGKGYKLL